MVTLEDPKTENDGNVRLIALAECKYHRSIRGMTVLGAMQFSLIYKNWNNLEFIPGTLMEVRGNLHVLGDQEHLIKARAECKLTSN